MQTYNNVFNRLSVMTMRRTKVLFPLVAGIILAACGVEDNVDSSVASIGNGAIEFEQIPSPMDSTACAPNEIFVFSREHKGAIQADLEAEGAIFKDDDDCENVLLNVRSVEKQQLVAQVSSYLENSKRVIIDTDGSDREISIAAEVARELTGGSTATAGIYIFEIQEGAMAVTPLETEEAYRKRQSASREPVSAGNTIRYVLGFN